MALVRQALSWGERSIKRFCAFCAMLTCQFFMRSLAGSTQQGRTQRLPSEPSERRLAMKQAGRLEHAFEALLMS